MVSARRAAHVFVPLPHSAANTPAAAQVIASAPAPIVSFFAIALREVPNTSAEPTKVSVGTISVLLSAPTAVVPVTAFSALTIKTGVWSVSVAVAMVRIAEPFKKRAAANANYGACVGLTKSR